MRATREEFAPMPPVRSPAAALASFQAAHAPAIWLCGFRASDDASVQGVATFIGVADAGAEVGSVGPLGAE